ncbi:GRAB protein, partial [Amia calva]|nr:GRAB protein [Amia calva]
HYLYGINVLFSLTGVFDGYIIGGKEAQPHSRPYMASLQIDGHHVCGGFLVRQDFVLTAAHCYKNRPLTVLLGAHNINISEKSQQRIEVKKYYKNPLHSLNINDFDIMLLKLKNHAILNRNVQVLALPTAEIDIPAKTMCFTAGWGIRQPNGKPDKVLREVSLAVQSNKECKKAWKRYFNLKTMMCTHFDGKKGICQLEKNAVLNKNVKVLALPKEGKGVQEGTVCTVSGWGTKTPDRHAENILREVSLIVENKTKCKQKYQNLNISFNSETMMCIQFNGTKGICKGDSGGPLICNTKAQGVVAFSGQKCDDPSYPHVFTKIPTFVKWIKEIMET